MLINCHTYKVHTKIIGYHISPGNWKIDIRETKMAIWARFQTDMGYLVHPWKQSRKSKQRAVSISWSIDTLEKVNSHPGCEATGPGKLNRRTIGNRI